MRRAWGRLAAAKGRLLLAPRPAAAEERRARAAQALRDNLRRRKAQARARDEGEARDDAADPLSGGRAGG